MNTDRETRSNKLLAPLLIAALYFFAVGFTNAHFMADSGGYVVSILAYSGVREYVVENPVVADYRSENAFWEFGHLFWRPLGFLLFKVFAPLSSFVVGSDPAHNVSFLLMSVNFVAGLVSAILLCALIYRLTGRRWVALFVSIGFIFSHAFLNFTQTGSSYIPGLAFLITALYFLLKDKGRLSPLTAIGGGLACAGAITLWAPYVLVIPGTIVAPLVLFELNGREKKFVLYAAAAFFMATGIPYLIVMASVGVHTPTDLRDWIAASSHGVRTSGLARMLFGFPRSFIHMGNDGLLFKRFLLNDPFNPVTATDLVRLSLWKLVLFYLVLGSLAIGLFISAARRRLLWLLLTAGPLIFFAIRFDGGAVERYLPIYAVIFLSLAWILSEVRVPRLLKIVPVVFFGFAVVVNVSVMARVVLHRQKQRTAERVQAIVPQLKPRSWLVTTHLQDDLVNFQASFPFEPVNRHNTYHVYPLVVLNSDQARRWREEFASNMLEAWAKGGDAWLSARLFSPKPQAAWNWVEGDDRRVPWSDIHEFFSQFQTGTVAGGADGFVLLEKSEANRNLLNTIKDANIGSGGVSSAMSAQRE
ncbi:MAG TPA: hypothetical protein VMM84_19385 [Pyrinomonadaceae bacterium]|nr:hypothetical protein [Pyrinomonadaceae bacterium]